MGIRGRGRTTACAAVALFFVAGCKSGNDEPPVADAAPSPCESHGGYCHVAYVNHGPGTPCSTVLDYACSDSNAECCPVATTITACGARVCNDGNTCDSNVDNYCSGVESSANCGPVACLGACTCKGDDSACDCPVCQPQGACDVGGTLLHCVAYPNEPLAPADAGACTALNDAGDFCCGAQP